ncbi:hypothetical protein [Saccharothrix xinjiangensis]|uniref:Uncharacterized protein n=1 Tax=Saccharothrix xinjiangensis TaxID=204798 RepID=A0ABV9Y042_9PSEU
MTATDSQPLAFAAAPTVLLDTPAGPLVCACPGRPPTAGALRVTLVNDRDTPFVCTGLTLTFPIGAASTALTDRAEDLRVHPPRGWTARHDPHGEITALPHSPAELPAGHTLSLTVEGIRVREPGITRVHLHADGHHPDAAPSRHTTTHLIRKDASQAILSSLVADPPAVERGGDTTLKWQVAAGTDPRFDLRAATTDLEVTEQTGLERTGDSYSFPIKPQGGLTQNTAFLLTAHPAGGQPDDHAVTLVTVTRGDIDAGNLSVNGTARILTTPTAYTLNPATHEQSIPVSTDGFLAATVHTGMNGEAATLDINLCPLGDEPIFTYTLATADGSVDENVLVPVPADTTIDLTLTGDYQPSATATWFPLGHGTSQGREAQS